MRVDEVDLAARVNQELGGTFPHRPFVVRPTSVFLVGVELPQGLVNEDADVVAGVSNDPAVRVKDEPSQYRRRLRWRLPHGPHEAPPRLSDRRTRWLQMTLSVSIAGLACLALVGAAQAGKPNIKVDPLGNTLRITFVAPKTSTLELRYFVRAETTRQEGCSWKSTGGGKGGRVGEPVLINLSPNSFQGRRWCAGSLRITVFMQKAQGGLIARDATAATFKLVGRVTYTMPA